MDYTTSVLSGRDHHAERNRHQDGECVVIAACDQCGRRSHPVHLAGGRAYCARCCPACARAAKQQSVGAGVISRLFKKRLPLA